jgi:hypothetical protein
MNEDKTCRRSVLGWFAAALALPFGGLFRRRRRRSSVFDKPAVAGQGPFNDTAITVRKEDSITRIGHTLYCEIIEAVKEFDIAHGHPPTHIMITRSMEHLLTAHMETQFGVGSRLGDKLLGLELIRTDGKFVVFNGKPRGTYALFPDSESNLLATHDGRGLTRERYPTILKSLNWDAQCCASA